MAFHKRKLLTFNAEVTPDDLKVYSNIFANEVAKVKQHLQGRRCWSNECTTNLDKLEVTEGNVSEFVICCRYIDLHKGFAVDCSDSTCYGSKRQIQELLYYILKPDHNNYKSIQYITNNCTFVGKPTFSHIKRDVCMLAMLYKGRMTFKELDKGTLGKVQLNPKPIFKADTELMSTLNWKLAKFFETEYERLGPEGLLPSEKYTIHMAVLDFRAALSTPITTQSYSKYGNMYHKEILLPFMCDNIDCYMSYFAATLAINFGIEADEEDPEVVYARGEAIDEIEQERREKLTPEEKKLEEEAEELKYDQQKIDPYHEFANQLCACRSHRHLTPAQGAALLQGDGLNLYLKIATYLGITITVIDISSAKPKVNLEDTFVKECIVPARLPGSRVIDMKVTLDATDLLQRYRTWYKSKMDTSYPIDKARLIKSIFEQVSLLGPQESDEKWHGITLVPEVISLPLPLPNTSLRSISQPINFDDEITDTGELKESQVRDTLAKELGGRIEVSNPSGRADIVTATELIEVKHWKKFHDGRRQLLDYAPYFPGKQLRLHLFGARYAVKHKDITTLLATLPIHKIRATEAIVVNGIITSRDLSLGAPPPTPAKSRLNIVNKVSRS